MGAIAVEALPAAYGDCLWVECDRDGGPPWRMVIDGGPPEAWPALRDRMLRLGPAKRHIDVVVVSHIDSDHIGGLLPAFSDAALGVTFGDVWFNGLPQLPEHDGGSSRSVAEGESLVALLSGVAAGPAPPWNRAFGGAAVVTGSDRAVRVVDVPDGPQIILLSPTPKRLAALRRKWIETLDRVRGGESEETAPPAPPEPLDDLPGLAARSTSPDASVPNGSSIAFLLEHRGASCLFAADAFPTVLSAALWTLANQRGGRPLALDAVKLPHHGSRGNVTTKLLQLAPARRYLISTNGERFNHPHDVALARVVTATSEPLELCFNYDTPALRRWAAPNVGRRFGVATQFPDAAAAGVRLELPARG